MAAAKKPGTYVTAEAVVVHVGTANERYLYKGSIVPSDLDADELARLKRRGLVGEVAAAE